MSDAQKHTPKFKTIQEEAEFWDTHDFTDYLHEVTLVSAPINEDEPKTTMSFRVPVSLKKRVDAMARKVHLSTSDLLRLWMIEKSALKQ